MSTVLLKLKVSSPLKPRRQERLYYKSSFFNSRTLEPEPWMLEVEKLGHGTRKVERFQEKFEILSELLATSLRTRFGLSPDLWTEIWSKMFRNKLSESPKPPFELFNLIESDEKCRTFFSDCYFEPDLEKLGLVLSPKGLVLLDYVLPYLVNSLERNLTSRTSKSSTN